MDLNNLVKGLLDRVGKVSKSEAVVGAVRDAGRAKVVPLSRIAVGFGTMVGSAGGEAKSDEEEGRGAKFEGGGAGGALVVEPRAFVVVGEDGIPHMLALKRGKVAVLRRGVELMPETDEEPALAEPDEAPKLPAKAVAAKGRKTK